MLLQINFEAFLIILDAFSPSEIRKWPKVIFLDMPQNRYHYHVDFAFLMSSIDGRA